MLSLVNMEIPKQTQYPLPILSEDTVNSFVGDVISDGFNEVLDRFATNVGENDPMLVEAVHSFLLTLNIIDHDSSSDSSIVAFVLTHGLLEKQAESNKMSLALEGFNKDSLTQTSYSLPKMQIDTHRSIVGDINETGDYDKYMTNLFNKLEEDNPVLLESVNSVLEDSGRYETEDDVFAARSAVLITHEILRKQAETDSMNDILFVDQN